MNTSPLTRRELDEINADMALWLQFEHNGWRLISFTGKQQARFGHVLNGQYYNKYVTVADSQIKFMRGVPPDVIDQF